jgi:hypothetical protein
MATVANKLILITCALPPSFDKLRMSGFGVLRRDCTQYSKTSFTLGLFLACLAGSIVTGAGAMDTSVSYEKIRTESYPPIIALCVRDGKIALKKSEDLDHWKVEVWDIKSKKLLPYLKDYKNRKKFLKIFFGLPKTRDPQTWNLAYAFREKSPNKSRLINDGSVYVECVYNDKLITGTDKGSILISPFKPLQEEKRLFDRLWPLDGKREPPIVGLCTHNDTLIARTEKSILIFDLAKRILLNEITDKRALPGWGICAYKGTIIYGTIDIYISASGNAINILDLETCELLKTLKLGGYANRLSAISVNDGILVSCHQEGSVKIWSPVLFLALQQQKKLQTRAFEILKKVGPSGYREFVKTGIEFGFDADWLV